MIEREISYIASASNIDSHDDHIEMLLSSNLPSGTLILFTRVDRLGRTPQMGEDLMQQMLSRGWSVEFICEPAVRGLPDAVLFSQLLILAEIETSILAARNFHYQELLAEFLGQ